MKKLSILRGEKLLYFLVAFFITANILSQSFLMAFLSKTNIEVERIRTKIVRQEKVNESLTMKINELASLNKVEEVASALGLGYNNSNVKIISE